MRAVIFAGGNYGNPEFYKNELKEDDFFIAADGGATFAEKLGILPDVAIGDFDTIDEKNVFAKEIIKLNREKDYTDSFEAFNEAVKRGFSDIALMGGTGERQDHSLANIFLLKHALNMGVNMCIIDEKNIIYITEDYIKLPKRDGCHLSVIQLTDVSSLSLSGLYYPLKNKDLKLADMLCISNEFTEDFCEISIKSGTILVMLTKD